MERSGQKKLSQQQEWERRWLLKEKYGGKETKQAKKDIELLKQGAPVDYLIGFVPFLDCNIDLSKKPFIPRQETEYWVGQAIEEIKKERKGKLIYCLDMFAGSGCIGTALLKHIPHAHVDFAEKNKTFLKQIEINLKINKIEKSRYQLVHSDISSGIKSTYDYIFANPPYIPISRKPKLDISVIKYEPHQALFADKDGMDYIKKMLKEAEGHLKPGGMLYMEYDSGQKENIEKLVKGVKGLEARFTKDQFGKWRSVQITRRT